ncbi:hypothetical protein PJE062_2390 [Pseudovibrio sp. JE062]|nr:hypothetical protein PJE062_2390 [Pseudovibrio sp. JE062]
MHFCNGWVKDFLQRFEHAAPTASSRAKTRDPFHLSTNATLANQ